MHSKNKMAIQIIEDDLRRAESHTTSPNLVTNFAQDSYSKSTYRDLIRLLKENEDVPPVNIIRNYVKKMEEYSCNNMFSSFIFSVSHDTAEYVLDELLNEGVKHNE